MIKRLTVIALLLLLLGGCAMVPPPVAAPVWPRAPFDTSALDGPFPQDAPPVPVEEFKYTALVPDEAALRMTLDPSALAVLGRLEWQSYPLVVDPSVMPTNILCLPQVWATTGPPPPTPWAGERCATFDDLRRWLGAVPPLVVTPVDAPPIPVQSAEDLQFLNPAAPAYIHLDFDDLRYFEGYGLLQFEPLSKRIVLTDSSLERYDREYGLRLHADVPDHFVVCVESPMANYHVERCTTFDRVRDWLERVGREMPPLTPEQWLQQMLLP